VVTSAPGASASTRADRRRGRAHGGRAWGGPGAALIAVPAVAWVAVVAWLGPAAGAGGPGGHHGPGHAPGPPYAVSLAAWTVMAAAMMLPLARKEARWLAFRSLPRRRRAAVGVFAAAHLSVWALAGVPAVAALAPLHGDLLAAGLALVAAAAWHGAPPRVRVLRRCASTRAPAIRGWRAVADWSRAGAVSGARCVATCWALMVPMAIVHHPALMVGAALAVAAERRRGPNPERRAGRPAGVVGLSCAGTALALVALAA
jgi:predicted metal-binding membrane protein